MNAEHFERNKAEFYNNDIVFPHYFLLFNNEATFIGVDNIKSGEIAEECIFQIGVTDSLNNY